MIKNKTVIKFKLDMKTCKEWIRSKLKTKINGSELEVRLPNGQVVDWLFERGANALMIEDKEQNDRSLTKAINQLDGYYQAIKDRYQNVIAIAVKAISNNYYQVRVFLNGIEIKDHPHNNLNSLDYYFSWFDQQFNRQELIKNINLLNQMMYEQNIIDNIRASLCSTLLIAISKGLELNQNDSILIIKDKVKQALLDFTIDQEGEDLNKWKKIAFLYNRFCADIDAKISTIDAPMIIKIYWFLKNNIWVYLEASSYQNDRYDVMSLFFTTFGKKALSNDLGQYFTPDHICDLMTELLELNVNTKVLDLACGSATFLTKCMDKMIAMANNDEQKINDIKANQIFGIEKDPNVMGLAIANMLLHQDGKSNLIQADCFLAIEKLKNQNIDRLILNPPYGKQGGYDELAFLLAGLDVLNPGGIAVIIVPLSCATGQKYQKLRSELLSRHTLKAVFSAPRELFYPVGTTTCIMVWQANIPHHGQTYLMDWRHDGFYKKRLAKTMATMVCDEQVWQKQKQVWLDDYFNQQSLGIKVTFDQISGPTTNWLYEAHLQFDHKQLTTNDFIKTLRSYWTYQIENESEDVENGID